MSENRFEIVEPESRTMKTLEVGDVVQLNSGGPKMTVNEVDGDWISCVWIEDGHLCEADQISSKALHTEPVAERTASTDKDMS